MLVLFDVISWVSVACISLCIVGVLEIGLSICIGYLHCWCPYLSLNCMDNDNIGVIIPTEHPQ